MFGIGLLYRVCSTSSPNKTATKNDHFALNRADMRDLAAAAHLKSTGGTVTPRWLRDTLQRSDVCCREGGAAGVGDLGVQLRLRNMVGPPSMANASREASPRLSSGPRCSSSASEAPPPRLSLGKMLCYANFQLASSALVASLQATRGYVFRDTLKMRLGTLSWILAVARGIDVATGAIVGRLSDRTRSRWGRRKPFIALAAPCGLLAWLGMPLAGVLFRRASPTSPLYLPFISQYLTNISLYLTQACSSGAPPAAVCSAKPSPAAATLAPGAPHSRPA